MTEPSATTRRTASTTASTTAIDRRDQLRRGFGQLQRSLGEPMEGFTQLHRSSMRDGELSRVTKELMALAIGICSHCDGCVALHVHDALRAGATRPQIEETIAVALMMGGGPSAVFGSDALEALAQFEARDAAR